MACRKKHLFTDCSGFNWRDTPEERQPHVTRLIRDVTCGQCKGRVQDVVRSIDWSDLKDDEVRFLDSAAAAIPQ